jgi:hypothetical protein
MKHFLLGLLFTTIAFSFLTAIPVSAQVRDWEVRDAAGNIIQDKSCTVDGVPTLQCLEVVYDNVLFLASSLVLLVLFAMLVYGGVLFITAFGSSEKIEQAQNTLKWSLIGIGLFAASYLILFIIDQAFLGGAGKIFELHIPGPSTNP